VFQDVFTNNKKQTINKYFLCQAALIEIPFDEPFRVLFPYTLFSDTTKYGNFLQAKNLIHFLRKAAASIAKEVSYKN